MSQTRFKKAQASIDNIKRSKFNSLSHTLSTSQNVGDLVPIYFQEVLPGDEISLKTNMVGRLQTPLAPVMDNLYWEYFYFFVPNRLLWDDWKYLMGESKTAWTDNTIRRVPAINLGEVPVFNKGSFADYLGLPPNTDFADNNTYVSVLPRRAYDLIWNEWFRDQNLQDPQLTFHGNLNGIELDRMFDKSHMLKANKMHDYFTSCLPSPQKGPSVHIPFDEVMLPVLPMEQQHQFKPGEYTRFKNPDTNAAYGPNNRTLTTGANSLSASSTVGAAESILAFSNLWATNDEDRDAVFGTPTINALRFAFQVQKIYEKDARSGTRYVELIRSHFGVVSPDARQQRPEFLGGGRETVGMQQQVATTAGNDGTSEANMLGTVGAYSYTNHSKFNFKQAFTEHGIIVGLAVLRYRHTYTQGVPRWLTRRDRFDFYDPTLAHLGEQPVYISELYNDGVNAEEIFGYQEAWADYRYNLNRATGDMRAGAGNLGNLWTYQDNYGTKPTLSAAWIKEDKANVERTLALPSTTVGNMYLNIYFEITAIRPMPLYSVPGMIDHF